MAEKVCILGSTGSIGTQALESCEHLGIEVTAIAAGSRIDILEQQIRKHKIRVCAVADERKALELKIKVADTPVKIISGAVCCEEICSMTDCDTVLNAITGVAGLLPTIAAIKAKKNIAIANKETLVAAGDIVNSLIKENNVTMLPVDSEHCAIHQCIDGRNKDEISKLIITASGGSMFGKTRKELENVKLSDALTHPNWSMGKKITIDSSTLVNKGLELIEAIRLFDIPEDRIDVLVHRESIVHSMASFVDGSVMAQLAVPDMRLCIQYALTYPKKKAGLTPPLNLAEIGKLSFYDVDNDAFPSVAFARRAIREGGVMPAVFNGANEACVDLFLQEKIRFTDIFDLIEYTLDSFKPCRDNITLGKILEADVEARRTVYEKAEIRIKM
ncbi:MAG: 1-deoxy-D-xylulose-5-phosphate reductoisomerase [Clostridia bacterium]|nr:1-deoxy-D-xylulose-5-phosphate reductoisomerase [Clostridia bacterium]